MVDVLRNEKRITVVIGSFLTLLSCSVYSGSIRSETMEISFNAGGEIEKISQPSTGITRPVKGFSSLPETSVVKVLEKDGAKGEKIFDKTLRRKDGTLFYLTESFRPTPSGIRWEIAIRGGGDAYCTLPIKTSFRYIGEGKVTHWLPWADPNGVFVAGHVSKELAEGNVKNGKAKKLNQFSWNDPLVDRPLKNAVWQYGGKPYTYTEPNFSFFNGDIISIPMITFMEKERDWGVSLILSAEDLILDMQVFTAEDGSVDFVRYNHRLGKDKVVRFSMDLVPHQADWRCAMDWVSTRYREYFNPPNPLAHEIAGTGAYSCRDVNFDVGKMKRMAFGVNWRASFDFPYMGMFLPPVEDSTLWNCFKSGPRKMSVNIMEAYCKNMEKLGFHVLSYFNVTEFGAWIAYPPPKITLKPGTPLWMNANAFIYGKLSDAIVLTPPAQKGRLFGSGGGRVMPYLSWFGAVVMDPGVKSYQDFLVDQARRHVEKVPSSSGICIDRLDWTRLYNHSTDDGVSWMGGQPVGSLNVSYIKAMDRIAPIFHEKKRSVFVNNHTKRIDQLRQIDGLFDEFTYSGPVANSVGLLCIKKPALGWMRNDRLSDPDPDSMIQKYLYLGIFPMCPFPGNDHSISPSALADTLYQAYGPLMKLMRGKEWVLKPHVIGVEGEKTLANLFKVPGGYTIPLISGSEECVKVRVSDPAIASGKYRITALHPAADQAVPVALEKRGNDLILTVPLKRGCAMVSMKSL